MKISVYTIKMIDTKVCKILYLLFFIVSSSMLFINVKLKKKCCTLNTDEILSKCIGCYTLFKFKGNISYLFDCLF